MFVILEQFPNSGSQDSDLFIIEGDFDRIEKWCLALPDQFALVAAMESYAYLFTSPISWEEAIQEFASDFVFSYPSDLHKSLMNANQEDACIFIDKVRELLLEQLSHALRARHKVGVGTPIRSRCGKGILDRIQRIRGIESLIEHLT